jgi:hypothetical protein
MRYLISLTAAAAVVLGATSTSAATKAATFQLNETTWTYVDPGKKVKAIESIDADGNYVENAVSGKHIDHGTGVMKDGRACFTSAMTKDGEVCWTTHPVKIGQSMKTVSNKGQKLTVTRLAYRPLQIPK